MSQESLTEKVGDKLGSGTLPSDEPVKTWAGYGRGAPCAACDAPILPAQIEYELDMPDGTKVSMHLGCHGLWGAERLRRVVVGDVRPTNERTA